MSAADVKLIIRAPKELLPDAARAAVFAINTSDFSHGYAVISRGENLYAIRKTKGGFSLFYQGDGQ